MAQRFLTPGGLAQLEQFCEQMTKGGELTKIADKTLGMMATRARVIIKQLYSSFPEALRTGATLATYQQGKRRGATPAKPQYPGGKDLMRTGKMAKSVIKRKQGLMNHIVTIDPSATYDQNENDQFYGRSVAAVARQLEEPVAVQLPITVRSAAYLSALRAGKAGPPGGMAVRDWTRIKNSNVGSIMVWPKPRRVWRRAHNMIAAEAPHFAQQINKMLHEVGAKIHVGGTQIVFTSS